MPVAAFVSFRLGGSDGVSIEAAKWELALSALGFTTITVAGEGPVDHLLPGLAIDPSQPVTGEELSGALAGADLIVVENLCSLPLNPQAASVVAEVCRDRRTILHHHDLPWQRERFVGNPPPPDDPSWLHVTINELSRLQLGEHDIDAVTIYNTFHMDGPSGNRHATRRELGLAEEDCLVLQPTRAIPRKNVAGGLALAETLDATFWLLGPAEEAYGPELDRLIRSARVPVHHGPAPSGAGRDVVDAYAACDVVALPSTWEGFGNPAIESAVYRRPLVIGEYPVGRELARFGFRWFSDGEGVALQKWLGAPDDLIEHNLAVARRHFSATELPRRIEKAMLAAGW